MHVCFFLNIEKLKNDENRFLFFSHFNLNWGNASGNLGHTFLSHLNFDNIIAYNRILYKYFFGHSCHNGTYIYIYIYFFPFYSKHSETH